MISRIYKNILMLFLIMAAAAFPLAGMAQVDVRVDRNPVGMDETFRLMFEVSGDDPGNPDFSPLLQDFEILGTDVSSNLNVVNGRMSPSKSWSMTMLPRRKGNLTVPPIRFGTEQSRALVIQVQDTIIPDTAVQDLFVEADAQPRDPYVQQQVLYKIKLFIRKGVGVDQPTLSPLSEEGGKFRVERLGEDSNYQTDINGVTYQVVERRYAMFPQESGALRIAPLVFEGYQGLAGVRYSDPFGRAQPSGQKRFIKRTKEMELAVKPIPPGFTGKQWLPVKDLRVSEGWSVPPSEFRQGEAATHSILLEAEEALVSQLPNLPDAKGDWFRYYPEDPQTQDDLKFHGTASKRLFRAAYIPVRAGEFTLPAVRIAWWNTEKDQQEYAELPARKVRVQADAASGAAVPPPGVGQGSETPVALDAAGTGGMSTDTPGMTGAGDGGAGWKWAFGGSLGLWALTVLWWWLGKPLRRRFREGRRPPTPEMLRKQQAWAKLKQACRRNDAPQAGALLLQWSRLHWESGLMGTASCPRSLGGFAAAVPRPLSKSVQELNACLYSKDPSAWQGGDRLLAALREFLRQSPKASAKASAKATPSQNALQPLYPN